MSDGDYTDIWPVIDAKEKAVSCADYFPSCPFVALNGQYYLDHVRDNHRLRDLHGDDRNYLHCPFKPCTVKTIAWSSLRGHMERHLSIHPSNDKAAAAAPGSNAAFAAAKRVGNDAISCHANADGSGHHWASMDHTISVVTPIYNQSNDFQMDATHSVSATSSFGFSAASGPGDAGH